MENFNNSILLPENLPEIESATFNPLDKKYLTIQMVRLAVVFLLLTGGLAVFLLFTDEKPPQFIVVLVAAAIVLVVVFSAVMTIMGFPKKGYLIREKDVSFQRGLITFKMTSVPLNRIQHVEINQGVLAKMLGLSSVKIYTAGGSSSDLTIPGLAATEARKVKSFLSGKISEYE